MCGNAVPNWVLYVVALGDPLGMLPAASYGSLRRETTCSRELRFSFLRMFVTWW